MVVFCLTVQLCLVLDQCYFFSGFDEVSGAKANVDIFTKTREIILRQRRWWQAYDKVVTRRPIWQRLHMDTPERLLHTLGSAMILVTEVACAVLNIILITVS